MTKRSIVTCTIYSEAKGSKLCFNKALSFQVTAMLELLQECLRSNRPPSKENMKWGVITEAKGKSSH